MPQSAWSRVRVFATGSPYVESRDSLYLWREQRVDCRTKRPDRCGRVAALGRGGRRTPSSGRDPADGRAWPGLAVICAECRRSAPDRRSPQPRRPRDAPADAGRSAVRRRPSRLRHGVGAHVAQLGRGGQHLRRPHAGAVHGGSLRTSRESTSRRSGKCLPRTTWLRSCPGRATSSCIEASSTRASLTDLRSGDRDFSCYPDSTIQRLGYLPGDPG
jgi:hypothetical protein